MDADEYIHLIEQTELEEYNIWYKSLIEENIPGHDNATPFCFSEAVDELDHNNRILAVADRWNLKWQDLKAAIDSGQIKLSRKIEYGVSNGLTCLKKISVGISNDEIQEIEDKHPELKRRVRLVHKAKKYKRLENLHSDVY